MKKIQKIIETCNDCQFMKVFNGLTGGTTKASLCLFGYLDNHEKPIDSFLLDIKDNGSNEILIPDNCPLENYEPKTDCR